MTDKKTKQEILDEFEMMKIVEQDAHELYLSASEHSCLTDQGIRNSLYEIAEDEKQHVVLVERIINILTNCL